LLRTGNELCGNGIGVSVAADQYASDVAALRSIVENEYRGIEPKPLVIAPGGFFDANWFKEFISKSGKSADVVTHHIYNLGPGIFLKTGYKFIMFSLSPFLTQSYLQELMTT